MNEKVIRAQEGPQREFLATKADICIYGGSAGGGKGNLLVTSRNATILGYNISDSKSYQEFKLKYSSYVQTPFGPKLIDDVEIGDMVCNPDGTTTEVIFVHPVRRRTCYRVTFIDGASVVVDDEHLWPIKISGKRTRNKIKTAYSQKEYSDNSERFNAELMRRYKNVTTTKLIELFERAKDDKVKNTRPRWPLIPMCEPVNSQCSPGKWFVIPPYTLGVLIGDGGLTAETVNWHKPDSFIYEKVSKELSTYGITDSVNKKKGDGDYIITGGQIKDGLRACGLAGLYSHEKFIPNYYKNGPISIRRDMLNGLMDTDGTADQRGHASFCSTSKRLIDDVQYLARSLGYSATITDKPEPVYEHLGEKKIGRPAWNIYITGRDRNSLFTLPRKKDRVTELHSEGGRRVINIEKVGDDLDSRCITVAHPNGLYITNDFIVTHNSFSLLMEPLRHIDVDGFNAVIYRRETTQVTNPGGLWDKAREMYGPLGAEFREQKLEVTLGKAKIKFAHLEHENDIYSWDGSEICLEGFDELQSFTERQFWYLLSRNRSMCGIRPYVRATCNPEPDSWLSRLISWWWDKDTGYAIPERSGVLRYFIRLGDKIEWADKPDDLLPYAQDKADIKSLTFIKSSVFDNKKLLEADPGYVGNLRALPEYEREIKLHGNWKIKRTRGMLFKREWFKIIPRVPVDPRTNLPIERRIVRAWDRASTAKTETNDPDYTAGVKISKAKDGFFYVEDVARFRANPADRDNEMLKVAHRDGRQCHIRLIQDPGQAGVSERHYLISRFQGFAVSSRKESGDKVERANPVASQAGIGKIILIEGAWNDDFLNELDGFTGDGKGHDDACLIAGTMVLTDKGEIEIEKIKKGDMVLTRDGYREVLESGKTGESRNIYRLKSSSGRELFGTGNHPIYADGMFVKMDSLSNHCTILECESIKQPLPQTRLNSTASNFADTHYQKESISGITTFRVPSILKMVSDRFIGKFGSIITVPYLKAWSFTMKTAIRLTMLLKTYVLKTIWIMFGSTSSAETFGQVLKSKFPILERLGISQKNGMHLRLAGNGIGSMELMDGIKDKALKRSAGYVVRDSSQNATTKLIAHTHVPGKIGLSEISLHTQRNAKSVRLNFSLNKRVIDFVQNHVLENSIPVYNLKVRGSNEYFANGILVHNCDALSAGFFYLTGESARVEVE